MKPTQEQVIAWAQESGALIAPFISLNDITFSPASLQDFAALAYEAGRNERAMTGKQCERCGEVNPAEIHTCTPKEQWEAVAYRALDKVKELQRLLDEAQPEQEPLAQMKEMLEVQGRDGTWNYDPYSHGMFNGMELVVALAEGRDPVFRKAPEKWIYTAPPQREWQGLTDEEREEATGWSVEHIEAKLKEKNGG